MTIAYSIYEDRDADLDSRLPSAGKEKLVSHRHRSGFQSRKGPVSVNGMHRRRNKKFTW